MPETTGHGRAFDIPPGVDASRGRGPVITKRAMTGCPGVSGRKSVVGRRRCQQALRSTRLICYAEPGRGIAIDYHIGLAGRCAGRSELMFGEARKGSFSFVHFQGLGAAIPTSSSSLGPPEACTGIATATGDPAGEQSSLRREHGGGFEADKPEPAGASWRSSADHVIGGKGGWSRRQPARC